MAANRDRYICSRAPTASNVTVSEQPLRQPNKPHIWKREEESSIELASNPATTGSQIAAPPQSGPAPQQLIAKKQAKPQQAVSLSERLRAPKRAQQTPAAPSHATLRSQPSAHPSSKWEAARRVKAGHAAAASPAKAGLVNRRAATQGYAKKRPNQLLRVSPRGAAELKPTLTPRQLPAKLIPATMLTPNVRVRATLRPLASLVHKGKHSLVRRTNIISAAARTVAAVRSPRLPQDSRRWVRPGVFSKTPQPLRLSRLNPKTRGKSGILPPGIQRQQWEWEMGSGGLGQGSGGAFQWRKGGAQRDSVHTPLAAGLAKRRFMARLGKASAGGKARKGPAKLVRIGSSLYRVSGTGGGRSLQRQVTPEVVPRAAIGQASIYQRQGNSLCRLLSNPTPTPLARIKQLALRKLRSGTPGRRPSPQGPKATARRGNFKLGMIAKIRSGSKFINQTCFPFCRTGICAAKENGACPLVHEPKNVAICLPWLGGRCEKVDCPLQHKRRTALMPLCMHFLTGNCTAGDCAYLHVMLDEKAEVCRNFQRGYCPKGASCLQKHLTIRQLHQFLPSKPTSWVAPKLPQDAPRRKRRRWPLPPEEMLKEEPPAKRAADGSEEGGHEGRPVANC